MAISAVFYRLKSTQRFRCLELSLTWQLCRLHCHFFMSNPDLEAVFNVCLTVVGEAEENRLIGQIRTGAFLHNKVEVTNR